MTAATMHIYVDWGGSDGTPGTASDITSATLRLKTAENITADTNSPIPVPDTGTNYSYWRQVYLKCTAKNDMTQVDNIKFFGDSAVFTGYTGVVLYAGGQLPTKNSGANTGYEIATGTGGTTGDRMDSGASKHSSLTTRTDTTTLTSGSPLSVTISESGSKIDASNETSNYVVLQLAVGSTASSGILSAETLTMRYDEI